MVSVGLGVLDGLAEVGAGALVVGAAEVGAAVVGAYVVGGTVVGVLCVGDTLGEVVTTGDSVGPGASFPPRAAHSAPAPRPSAIATITAMMIGALPDLGSSGGGSGSWAGGMAMVG